MGLIVAEDSHGRLVEENEQFVGYGFAEGKETRREISLQAQISSLPKSPEPVTERELRDRQEVGDLDPRRGRVRGIPCRIFRTQRHWS